MPCAQWGPTLCSLRDCSPPSSSVHGMFQARILEWVATFYSRGSSQPRDWTCVSWVSYIGRQILNYHRTWEAPIKTSLINLIFLSPEATDAFYLTITLYLNIYHKNIVCSLQTLWKLLPDFQGCYENLSKRAQGNYSSFIPSFFLLELQEVHIYTFAFFNRPANMVYCRVKCWETR